MRIRVLLGGLLRRFRASGRVRSRLAGERAYSPRSERGRGRWSGGTEDAAPCGAGAVQQKRRAGGWFCRRYDKSIATRHQHAAERAQARRHAPLQPDAAVW